MKIYRNLFVIFLLSVIVTGCDNKFDFEQGQNNPNDKEGNTQVVGSEVTQYLAEIYNNENSEIIFKSNTPKEYIPKVGEYLCATITQNTPYGLLVKVNKVDKKQGQFYVEVEEAYIEDAFEFLSIDSTLLLTSKMLGVFDEDGNPVDYTFVDDVTGEELAFTRNGGDISISTRASVENWDNISLSIPFEEKIGSNVTIKGSVNVKYKFSFSADINNRNINYLCAELVPSIGIKAEAITKFNGKQKVELKGLRIPFGAFAIGPVIVRPVGIIIPEVGMDGEISMKAKLEYTASSSLSLYYKNNSWGNSYKSSIANGSPWVVSDIELQGNIGIGAKVGVLFGFYSTTTGVGINAIPKFKTSANFSFSANDLLISNPKVDFSIGVETELYFAAKIFGKKLGKYNIYTPEMILWKESVGLLPHFDGFSAIGETNNGVVSYSILSSSNKLLPAYLLPVKHGTTIYNSNQEKLRSLLSSTSTQETNKSDKRFDIKVDNLSSGGDYYASPLVSFLGYEWHGEKIKFSTEGSYTMYFRCASQTYDVLSLEFSLNSLIGNSINVVREGNDYSGEPMKMTINATYNEQTNQLIGSIDFLFYDDPGQRRTDGFTIDLSDDTGYVPTYFIVANGGCGAAIRIVNNNKTSTKSMTKYNGLRISDDNCIGTIIHKRR